MPTYDYKCQACGHEFEKFQSITSPVVRKCPRCGKIKVRRLIGTGAGIIFKGSGFYQTDYRSDAYKQSAKNDKPATAAATTPGAASSVPEGSAKTSMTKAEKTKSPSHSLGDSKSARSGTS
jgi:putative FmdB family regulatory protein